jgi:hypothetical protein
MKIGLVCRGIDPPGGGGHVGLPGRGIALPGGGDVGFVRQGKYPPITVFLACILLAAVLMGCGLPAWSTLLFTPTPASTPTAEWQEGMPRDGQPAFPALGRYWVIDNGCGFDPQKVKIADALFEKLRTDGIAEVAVICQTGIVDKGGTNDEKIWLRDWARWAKMGEVEEARSVVWLIRPDAGKTEQRISVEISRWLYWYTAIQYADGLNEAARYANAGDTDGALVAIARNTDEKLRLLWITHQPTP